MLTPLLFDDWTQPAEARRKELEAARFNARIMETRIASIDRRPENAGLLHAHHFAQARV